MNQTKTKAHLSKDKTLKKVLEQYTVNFPTLSTNLFRDLLEAIVSQQLSGKAATTIFNRFLTLFSTQTTPTPQDILALSEDSLRSCGLSRQKTSYLKSLSKEIISNNLVLEDLNSLEDEEVITALTKVKGIGRWTAEMFLIFSLGRPDTFSLGDLGLRTAISKLYELDREDIAAMEEISQKWAPFRSLAALFLWKSLDNR